MSKKNIIIINGKHYDTTTGSVLGQSLAKPATPAAVTAAVKPTHKTVSRSVPKHAQAHAPKASRTLMRRAVRKPSPSHKQPVKAQGHLDTVMKRALGNVQAKPSVKRLDTQRLRHAHAVSKSQSISRFSANLFSGNWTDTAAAPIASKAPVMFPKPAVVSHKKPQTTAELLDYALKNARSHEEAPPKLQRRSLFKRRARSATT